MIEQQIESVDMLHAEPEITKPEFELVGRSSQAMGSMVKRPFDVLVSLVSLFLLSPLFVFIGLLIKLDSSGPVFYRGERIGKDGKPFWMYKFRTMKDVLTDTGPRVTAHDDPRITRIGHILRDTKLNELPQFINVLKGEMSLVGPRPEDPSYVTLYTSEQRRALSVTPGITSMASIVYRDEETMLNQDTLENTYVNVIMPDKLWLDMEYIAHRSFLVDLDILFRTFLALLPRFTQAAPEIEELFFGPVQRFIRRHLSWFTLDLLLGLGAILATNFIWWRASHPLHVGWSLSVASTIGIALTFTLVNQFCGLQRSMWSCASAQEIVDILWSTIFSTILLLVINELGLAFPVEMILLSGFFAFVVFTVARYRSRLITGALWRWRNLWGKARGEEQKRLLIVGAGEVGQLFAWQVQHRREGQRYQIVGFVDDDLTKQRMRIHGVEVLGGCRAISALVAQYDVDMIAVAGHNLVQREYQAIVDVCRHTPAQVKVIPDVLQLIREPKQPLLDKREGEIVNPSHLTDGYQFVAQRAALVTDAASSEEKKLEHSTLVREAHDLESAYTIPYP
jgi:lipopolysaccharide/colanic/teichoic acid biosynthesis glycosyltransferase